MTSPDCPYVMFGQTRPDAPDVHEECALWKKAAQDALLQININAAQTSVHEKIMRAQVRVQTLKTLKAYLEGLIRSEELNSWEDKQA